MNFRKNEYVQVDFLERKGVNMKYSRNEMNFKSLKLKPGAEIKRLNRINIESKKDYEIKIQEALDKTGIMKDMLQNALARVSESERRYSAAKFSFEESLSKRSVLKKQLADTKSEERLLQLKYGDRIAEAKDRAYKDWQSAENDSRRLYAEVGEMKKVIDEAYEKGDHELIGRLRVEREKKKLDQKCITGIKKLKFKYFKSMQWIGEVCPKIPELLNRYRDIKDLIEKQNENVLCCKAMVNEAQMNLADARQYYEVAKDVIDSGLKAQEKRYLEESDQLSIKKQLGINERCVIYCEGSRAVHVLYGGKGEPDGKDHGHIVMDNLTKMIFYNRLPEIKSLN